MASEPSLDGQAKEAYPTKARLARHSSEQSSMVSGVTSGRTSSRIPGGRGRIGRRWPGGDGWLVQRRTGTFARRRRFEVAGAEKLAAESQGADPIEIGAVKTDLLF
jgi:hypothetical protein